ncbi:32629_t:CDS:2, partial [Gigaspora margarita]
DQDIIYENVEIDSLVENVVYALNEHYNSLNKKNSLAFCFGCITDIGSLEMALKQVADFLIDHIEDADNYKWRTNLFQQTRCRKNQDISKHRDTKSIERYDCNGMIRISINCTTLMATIYIRHGLLHSYPKDVSVSDNIKQFIMNNINLLPREIYAQLVENGLDLSISSKQVHNW